MFHFFLRLSQVIAYDVIMSDPNHPLTKILSHVSFIKVNSQMFFDFIRIQIPLVFLVSIYAGCGMVCNDFKDNLMEIYFSKPLNWHDYVAGKVMTLVSIGLAMTAVPALILVVTHNMLAPSLKTLHATWWIPFSIVGFSLVVVVPCAVAVLASSSLLNSQRFAGISVFMILFADMALGTMLREFLHARGYMVLSFPVAVNRVGEIMFRAARPMIDVSWIWSAVIVGAVCAAALWIICAKVRRAEIAA